MSDLDEFFDQVGVKTVEALRICEKEACERRIIDQTRDLDNYAYTLTCPNCFEHYAVTKLEYESWIRNIQRVGKIYRWRRLLKKKYGPNERPADEYPAIYTTGL